MARIRHGQSSYNAAYYKANRDRIRAQQTAYRVANQSKITAARKGLTLAQVDALLRAQDGCCAICRAILGTPHIDHDHTCCPGGDACGSCTRGLLCASCNHMLGKAHDAPDVLDAGAAYLRRYMEGSK